MSHEDMDRINALLLEQQAQILVMDAKVRTLRHLLGQVVQILTVEVQPEGSSFEDAFRGLVQSKLNLKLAAIADGDPSQASALTKLLLSEGVLKQTNDDSSGIS